ncbi:MAG: xylulokinase, partial [Chloroflexota bacterium]
GVTPAAAQLTGLHTGTPVVAGCMDTVGAAVGSGAVFPNESFAILGTVARVAVALDQPRFDDRFINCCHAVPGQWVALSVTNGSGVSMRWFRDLFGQMEVAVAREMGCDHYDLLTQQAAKSAPGANGLLYLPYIAAERSPIWDPYARGVFFGMSVGHKRGDFVRAMMEGVALSIRDNLAIMKESVGARIDKLRAGGGCARSPLWDQIIADVTGHTIVTMRASETETLGTAILAGVGTGVYGSFAEARERTLNFEGEFPPRKEYAPLYDGVFHLYKQLYEDLRPRFAEAARLYQR